MCLYSDNASITHFTIIILCDRLWLTIYYYHMNLSFFYANHNLSHKTIVSKYVWKFVVLALIIGLYRYAWPTGVYSSKLKVKTNKSSEIDKKHWPFLWIRFVEWNNWTRFWKTLCWSLQLILQYQLVLPLNLG